MASTLLGPRGSTDMVVRCCPVVADIALDLEAA